MVANNEKYVDKSLSENLLISMLLPSPGLTNVCDMWKKYIRVNKILNL